MAENTNQLQDYVLKVLNENGFDKLDDEAKKTYLPQFMAQAEQRLGAALLPLMTEESAKEFVKITENEKTTPEDWWNFWQTHVPNFTAVVQKTLQNFAAEVKTVFSE